MISKRNRYLLLSVLILTILSIGGALYTKKIINDQARNLNVEQTSNEHAQAGNIVLTETQDGQRLWEISTVKADYDPTKNYSNLEKLSGKIFTPDDKVKFEFTANSGRYYKDTKSFELTGNASLNAPSSKVSVHAGNIYWASRGENIRANGGVVLEKPGSARTSAGSAVFSQDFSYVEFAGGVTTHIMN